jgi:hypothetical protein
VFINTVNENTAVPCIIADNKFIVQEGWEFFVDNSETYFLKYKEIDLPQEEFDKLKE